VPGLDVHGTARTPESFHGAMPAELLERVRLGVDALDIASVHRVLDDVGPDVVVNCIGVIKQDPALSRTSETVQLNALLPHQLAERCARDGSRLIQVSTDCVFSGAKGGYEESDLPDPSDFYGRAKLLGEIHDSSALTLRTSIVGHELGTARSLIDWFLSQEGTVQGYTRAIYSGLTTTELARMLASVVFPATDLTGLFHVASPAISKHELLGLVAAEYAWQGTLTPYDDFACDRSLSAARLKERTGYETPAWPAMIKDLRDSARAWGLRP